MTTPLTTPLKESASCPRCSATGWVTTDADDPGATLRRCSCYANQNDERRLKNSLIPQRYRIARLNNFDHYPGIHETLQGAQLIAEKFAETYPNQKDPGLLFQGPSGVGKTHLAVAVLRELVTNCGITGRFVDYRDLLRSIQNSYNPVSETSELGPEDRKRVDEAWGQLTLEKALESRSHPGAAGAASVKRQLRKAESLISRR